jgi:hypothetical protein
VPAYTADRATESGEGELDRRSEEGWRSLMSAVQRGIKVVSHEGEAAVASHFEAMLDGKVAPDEGHLFHL